MLNKIRIVEAGGTDPYENLALEQYLLEHLDDGEGILYLWQNKNTVVIGKNQNAWAECRVSLLEEEGGRMARRLSGGGAVFHDLGNLNFTFLFHEEDYDLDKQLSVIIQACRFAGIPAERSGRNDILTGGRKFSGNAFYRAKGRAYHHGTLLIASDMDKLQRYLSPPKAKLESKGVSSVRSRVVNLSELVPGLTCQDMKAFMVKAFQSVYGMEAEVYMPQDQAELERLTRQNRSWKHLFGSSLPFSFQCEGYFSWGYVQLQLQSDKGIVQAVKIYTDAMDWTISQKIEDALTGCRFRSADLITALFKSLPKEQAADIAGLLEKQV